MSECPEVGPCKLVNLKVAPTDDGRLWVMADAHEVDPDPHAATALLGVWLALHETDGRRIHTQMADRTFEDDDREAYYRHSLAVDGRGHLFLGMLEGTRDTVTGNESSRRWIAEYGADGEPVGERTAIAGSGGAPLLSRVGDDEIAVGQRNGGGIALLTTDGTRRWTQTRINTVPVGVLLSDPRGRVTLSGQAVGGPGLEHYDEQGRFAWHLTFDRLDSNDVAVDWDGNLVRAGMPVMDSPFDPKVIWVHKLDAAGQTVWHTEIASSTQSYSPSRSAPVIGPRGEILIMGTIWVTGIGAGPRAVIHEVSADGASCRYFEVDSDAIKSGSQLMTATTDGLFFTSGNATGTSFGRLAQ